jgi:HSP20 family protein
VRQKKPAVANRQEDIMFAVKTNIPTLFNEFNTFNNLFDSGDNHSGELRPSMDVTESGDHFVVTAELPGVDEKDISIEFADNVLSLSAERKIIENQSDTWHRREIAGGKFSRSMKFSTPIEADKISASYKNGMLEISLPKVEALKPRKIKLTVA